MATKKTTEEKQNVITAISIAEISIPIRGTSPLIVSRFDEKSKQQIEESGKTGLKQGGKKKNIISPEEQYEKSIYYLSDGKRYGFPAVAFKAAMVTAAKRAYGKDMADTRCIVHVVADDPVTGLVEIKGEPRMREDMVRVGGISKVASPRYRAEFTEWKAVLHIEYLDGVITKEEIATLIQAAGFTCGVGEWRPQKSNSGSFGRFTIDG